MVDVSRRLYVLLLTAEGRRICFRTDKVVYVHISLLQPEKLATVVTTLAGDPTNHEKKKLKHRKKPSRGKNASLKEMGEFSN